MKFFVLSACLLNLLFPALANANPGLELGLAPAEPDAMVMLGTIESGSNDSTTSVTIQFNAAPKWKTPKLDGHGTFLQLDLPKVFIPNPGQFLEGNSPVVKKIAVFQTNSTDGGIRLFLGETAEKVLAAVTTELKDKTLTLTVDHKKIGQVEIASTIPDLTNSGDDTQAATGLTGFQGIELRSRLIKIAAFLGALMFMAALLWMIKPLLNRRRRARSGKTTADEPEVFALNKIASMKLSPKQEISVIQVGDQKIVIGTNGETMTFLTNLTQPAAPQPQFLPQLPQQSPLAAAISQSVQLPTPDLQSQQSVSQPQRPQPATFQKEFSSVNPDTLNLKLKENPLQLKQPETPKKTKPKKQQKVPKPQVSSRINIAVGDEIEDLSPKADPKQHQQAMDDVTSLIRQKLKSLKAI